MIYDVLIIGGGVSGVSCALILGSAQKQPYTSDKKIGIIAHQKTSALNSALFNNAYGIAPNTLGSDLMKTSLEQLSSLYPHVDIIEKEKVGNIKKQDQTFELTTLNKSIFKAKNVVVAIGAGSPFPIHGLESYIEPHKKSKPEKQKIQLINSDHLVAEGLYVAGVLAGHRSQLMIAAGSGAAVATDILTLWNNGIHSQIHDAVDKN